MRVPRRLGKPLPRSFYLRPTLTVARDLLGKYTVRRYRDKLLIGKIVEVEAYIGPDDPASHAYVGMTERNKVMFGEGGHAYVYFTYGMHFCFNVVTEREGSPAAVLVRAVEPIEGIEEMRKNRRFTARPDFRRDEASFISRSETERAEERDKRKLTNGPAKFCQAFGIRREMNGTDLTRDELFLTKGKDIPRSKIGSSRRVGIRNGKEKKWRFFVKGNKFVSTLKLL
jgi:DNA-3-methyladenine glycosylase